MGLRFRKSINIGPFRMNISKSGISHSVGIKGFRKQSWQMDELGLPFQSWNRD